MTNKTDRSEAVDAAFSAIKSLSNVASMDHKNQNAAVAAIQFALETDDGLIFLRLWNQGDFDKILNNWPDAPEAVYGHFAVKGDDIAIRDDDKFRGTVGDARPVLERMNASLGVEDQGVLVNKNEENFEVKFRFNPALQKRIQRIDGASFDKSLDAWLVPAVHEEFLARAVSDMRHEFSSEVEDKQSVKIAVSKQIDAALIRDAFTGHGTETSGMVLAVNDRFVAQHTGRNYVAIHRIDQLSEVPDLHSSVKVRYEKGKGAIIPPKEKSNSLSR